MMPKRRHHHTLLATLLASIVLAGCASTPSASDVEQIIRRRIAEQSEGRIRLLGFREINAQKGEVMGVEVYSIEWEAEIEFTEDCYWQAGTQLQRLIETNVSFRTSAPTPSQGVFDWNDWTLRNDGYVTVKAGERRTVAGKMLFEATQRGWRGPDGEIVASATQRFSKEAA